MIQSPNSAFESFVVNDVPFETYTALGGPGSSMVGRRWCGVFDEAPARSVKWYFDSQGRCFRLFDTGVGCEPICFLYTKLNIEFETLGLGLPTVAICQYLCSWLRRGRICFPF